jgi:archaellum biogenesis ATPase FlaH
MIESVVPIRKAMKDLFGYLCNPPESIKLPTWFSFNEIIGGFRANEFTILCGSTGAGKTSLLANMSAQLLEGKVKHFVMSVETGHMDYVARVLSVLVNEDLNTGDPIPKEKLMRIGMNHNENLFSDYLELSLYDNRIPLKELLGNLKWAVDNGCKIAFIDNLNFFLEVTSDQNMVAEMDRVTHELIMFCKRNPIHIVMVMHPKKTIGTRVISEFDIKGSTTAVQEANNILLWNRPERERIENGEYQSTDRELLIAKLRRRGKYTGRTLVFDGRSPKYVELGCVSDDVKTVQRSSNEKTQKPRFTEISL